MDDDKYCIGFIIGILATLIYVLILGTSGSFNIEETENLANDVCELKFNSSAKSYEWAVLTCNNPNIQTYQIDYNKEGAN